MSLMFRVRCSCIYTWVNLNLKRIVSAHNPFLLTEEYHSHSRSSLPYLLTQLCFGVFFCNIERKLAKMQKFCKSASFLFGFEKMTLTEDLFL